MKSALALSFLILPLISNAALACAPAEAQFIGQVTASKVEGKTCFVKVGNWTMFNESGVCPLDESNASSLWLSVSSCQAVGSFASGYISVSEDGSAKLN